MTFDAVGQLVPTRGGSALWMAYLSEAYLLVGRINEALKHALRALDLSREYEVYRQARKLTPNHCAFLFIGRFPEDMEVVL